MHRFAVLLLAAVLVLLSACASKVKEDGTSVAGEAGKPGAFLAYEHTVVIALPPEQLSARLRSVREACADARFGSCSLLRIDESAGNHASGLLVLRVAPDAVEPLVTLGSEGGTVISRQTQAEDLAQVVADTTLEQDRLQAQRTQLQAFQARTDLSVSDLLTLARELASLDAQAASTARVAANQQRRLETNLLTLRYSSNASASPWSSIGNAFDDMFESLAEGVSEAIGMLAFGLPFLLVIFPVALLWRWLWRRATGQRTRVE